MLVDAKKSDSRAVKRRRCWESRIRIDDLGGGPGKGMNHETEILVRQSKQGRRLSAVCKTGFR